MTTTDMPERFRVAMDLRAKGVGPTDIARRMGIPRNTATGYLSQAAKLLGFKSIAAMGAALGWPDESAMKRAAYLARSHKATHLVVAATTVPDVRTGMVIHVHLLPAPLEGIVRAVSPQMVLLDGGLEFSRRHVHTDPLTHCRA